MNRSLSLLSSTLAITAAANAQCFNATGNSIAATLTPTSIYTADDEGISPQIAFQGFTFPLGGTNWTDFAVSSNGEIYLTDGTGVAGQVLFGIGSLTNLRGFAGDSPRIMAFGGDLQGVATPGSWDILVDDSTIGEVKISWTGVRQYLGAEDFDMSVTLGAGGIVQFDYSNGNWGMPSQFDFAALSAGNQVGTGTEPSSDLSAGADSGTVELIYQNDWQPFDLADSSILLTPNGSGGYMSSLGCGLAGHNLIGEGCYNLASESFYQLFTDAAVASATLEGNGMQLALAGNGYAAVWLPGVATALYVPPTAAATNLPVLNDGEVTYTPSTGFPSTNGVVTDLTVSGNGIIAFGTGPIEPTLPATNWIPNAAEFLAASHGGIYCWHPYNEEEGGDVWAEELGGVLYITFENVENFPNTSPNPSTFQVQINQSTGEIFILWVDIDTNNTTIFGLYPQDHLIGFTPPGASMDPMSIDLPTQLPIVTMPDVEAISLMAGPAPISTPSSGTTVTYQVLDAPELVPGSATVAGVVILSLTDDPGLDLGFLGAPGCRAYVGGLDLSIAFVGAAGPQSVQFDIPAGVPSGTFLYAQAAALSSGINAFGLVTSNAIGSLIGPN